MNRTEKFEEPEIEQTIHKAAVKAVKATNLCMKHMEYHGQKTTECTPQERQIIEITKDLI